MFEFGDSVLDPRLRELRRVGAPVALQPQVFDLLEYLILRRDRVVTRDELVANVWNGRIVSDSTIAVRINAARRAIGDSGEAQRFIRTLPRKGFRFVAAVREATSGAAVSGRPPGEELSLHHTADGLALAVATVGAGPTLVRAATWLNHLEHEWSSPIRLPLLRFMAERFHLVRYDGRGTGLSDREARDISFAGFLRDLDTVVESLGLERYALLGVSQGAAIAIAHAARHPGRVTRLVVHGSYAAGRNRRGTQADTETARALRTLLREGWGVEGSAFLRAFSSLYLPDGSAEQVRWFADLQRSATSAENALRLRDACDDIDVRDLLAQVQAPTLVLHSRGDAVVPFEEGRKVADGIPGARFVPLESRNHILLEAEPAWTVFTAELEAFLLDTG